MKQVVMHDTNGNAINVDLPEFGSDGRIDHLCDIPTTKYTHGGASYLILGPGYVEGDGGLVQNLGYSLFCDQSFPTVGFTGILLHSITGVQANGTLTSHGCSSDEWGDEISPMPAWPAAEGSTSFNNKNHSSEIIGNYTPSVTNLYWPTRRYIDYGRICYPWRISWDGWLIQIRYRQVKDVYIDCDVGTFFDINLGICSLLPGWEWTPDGNIKTPCFETTASPEGAFRSGIVYVITIKLTDDAYFDNEEEYAVSLSFNASTIKVDKDFYVSDKLVYLSNEKRTTTITLWINHKENFEDELIVISANSKNRFECPDSKFKVDSQKATSCCGYVPDVFDGWKYGFGVPKLIPPRERGK